jgi:hypothetical protein
MSNNAKTTELITANQAARLATLDELIKNILPLFIVPVPSKETVRAWLDDGKIPRLKSNPMAIRGGGPVYYSVAAVEKYFRARILPKMGGRVGQ